MGAQSVERALSLLVAIVDAGSPIGVTDLARQVELHPATAHRLLGSLLSTGFVAQEAEGARYRVGPTFARLARAERERLELPELARPILERLVAETDETAGVVQLDGDETVVVARAYSSHALRVHTPIGGRGPLHATAVGKILLAAMPEAARERMLAGPLAAFTEATLTDAAALRAECAAVEAAGYALGIEDHRPGVATVAAPVIERDGVVVAALSLSGPVGRMAGARLADLITATRAAAVALSHELGADVGHPDPMPALDEGLTIGCRSTTGGLESDGPRASLPRRNA